MKRTIASLFAAAALLGSAAVAAEIEVTIQNVTSHSYFTPLLVAVHPHGVTMFTLGEPASVSLQAMAEGGDISGLNGDLAAEGAETVQNPAGGLLAPGMNGWQVPTEAGSYSFTLNAYDAGTEANDEIVNGGGTPGVPGIPADPGGLAGSGATGVAATIEGYVHIHRGIVGDTNSSGGPSDLDSRYHRWLNPVAVVTVTVK